MAESYSFCDIKAFPFILSASAAAFISGDPEALAVGAAAGAGVDVEGAEEGADLALVLR
jgi:hypothetical protein